MLAVGIIVTLPVMKNEAVTPFASNGEGPVFAGALFPFVFITIACGALSGFHALIASGTTPKMIEKETQVRFIGYGAMLMESFVAVMAMIAACIIEPGLYYAMNAPAGVLGDTVQSASQAVNGLRLPDLARRAAGGGLQRWTRRRSIARTGGAPTLAIGMSEIFAGATGQGLQGLLVPLRDHVRGPVHPHHGGCGDAGRALHAPGHARQRDQAVLERELEAGRCGSRARSSSPPGAGSCTAA